MKKIFFISFITGMMGVVVTLLFLYFYTLKQVPDMIYVDSNEEKVLSFHAPVSGSLTRISESKKEGESLTVTANINMQKKINLMDDLKLTLREGEKYRADLKFLGVIPYKTVDIIAKESPYLYPLGDPIGIYIKIDGVLVIDSGSFLDKDGFEVEPCQYVLQSGDYITAIDGESVSKKKDVTELIRKSQGKALKLTIRRDGKEEFVMVQPVLAKDNIYKLGIWIRDSLQGIGTITAMDESGNYIALGHAVNDCDTGDIVEISFGKIYQAAILSVINGEKGNPGELNGVIQYKNENILGEISDNSEYGINGVLYDKDSLGTIKKAYPIAYKQDVKEGKAYIISDLQAENTMYEIEIKDVRVNTTDNKRGIIFEVTDKNMLQYSGGIVQGMSGSPIIQDGKIVGAVTHVLVNDPTRGYGIFLESMLNHGN